ncbi:MAG TPA: FkbM family methyltransferase [Acidimicrobiales bacterium]|nr:FkbM family methyltransferase [Acidimicrobiales bacterium]
MPGRWTSLLAGRRRPALPPHVRVDTDVGPLLYPAHDKLMPGLVAEQGGRWEPEESDLLLRWLSPGMTFVDIGAHVGYMTLLGSRAVGPTGAVVAVEASPLNAALLRANVAANRAANVEVVEGAAGDRSGRVELSLSDWNSGDNRAYGVPGMERVEVDAVRLDDVLRGRRVDVVKVDTQGTDHRAVAGMEASLRRWRPPLLVEFWPPTIAEQGDDPLAVLAGYRHLGYEVRMLGRPEDAPPPHPQAIVDAALATQGQWCNLVLLPA